jgi:hypothetical protein
MAARGIAKQLLGTVVAVLAGWLAALLFFEVIELINFLSKPHVGLPEALWLTPLEISLIISVFVVPIWLLVLVPLYIFVPPSSMLWRVPVCSACGIVAGVLIVALVFGGIPGSRGLAPEAWWWFIAAAIVGGVTCLIGSLTRNRFKPAI